MSLPDNMISKEEAGMLARMIKQNPPLVTLNISNNNLESECAMLLAESLQFNNRLKVLNVSKNKLGDFGIEALLRPLIKQKFDNYTSMQKLSNIVYNNSTDGLPNDVQEDESLKVKLQ